MNRVTCVARTGLVGILRFDHPAELPHEDPPEEVATAFSLAFVERGHYEITLEGARHRFGPGMVFVSLRDQAYRCRHDGPAAADTCLIVEFEDGAADELLRAAGGSAAFAPSNRLAYGRLRLLAAARNDDPLALESSAGEILGGISAAATTGTRPYREAQVVWYARRVDAVRELLETRYAEPHSLPALGRAAAMSPFQLARVFRELAGVPPHRYLLSVRLDQAARRLRDGMAVTDTCFDVGFSNLSHFIRSFRRAFGVSPSRFPGGPERRGPRALPQNAQESASLRLGEKRSLVRG